MKEMSRRLSNSFSMKDSLKRTNGREGDGMTKKFILKENY